jgi:triosephosphate isomerase (TIM)
MRKKIVAANWKMNLNLAEGKALVDGVLAGLPAISQTRKVVIGTPYIHLTQTAQQLQGTHNIHLAAQNCYSEASGAYTGEISAAMVKDTGAEYVILGHSERRQYFNESDATVAKKTDMALQNGLQVIFCCGEPLDIRDAATENSFVEAQIKAGLFHLSAEQLNNITIAYEPIWAIGTGRTATSQQAQDMHAHIRSVIAAQYGQEVADSMSILYGGSCNAGNASELFDCPDVDGGLIGGASLKPDTFLAIINAMVSA